MSISSAGDIYVNYSLERDGVGQISTARDVVTCETSEL